GLDVVNGEIEDLDRLFASFSLNLVECAVDDALCDGFLARQHNNVHEFGELYAAKLWIGENFTFGYFATTRHFYFLVTVQLNRDSRSRPFKKMVTYMLWAHAQSCTDETRITGLRIMNYAFFGRFAPYLERDCLRSFTPCRSSEPRTMW